MRNISPQDSLISYDKELMFLEPFVCQQDYGKTHKIKKITSKNSRSDSDKIYQTYDKNEQFKAKCFGYDG